MREERRNSGGIRPYGVSTPAKAPRTIGGLMAEILKATAGPKRRELLELSEAWARVVGPEMARRSRPLGLGKGGQLTIGFESSALRQEVQAFRKEEILGRLQAEYRERRIATLKCVLEF
ncbi:MAG TPA: DUF721 domain-containing protein [Planctomycetota bacterium]|nr:DUF721 domain-containing protein [Planctomycetota bacterium]